MSKKKLSIAEEFRNTYVVDESAETIADIVSGSGLTPGSVSKMIQKGVRDGIYEKVRKHINGRIVIAFRRKEK